MTASASVMIASEAAVLSSPMPKRQRPAKVATPETILSEHTPRVRSVSNRLRELIKRTIPDSAEVAYPGWHGIGYRDPIGGYICGIFPQRDSVKLGFEMGARLPDPDGVLGSGRQVRYVEVRRPEDIPVEAIQELLVAAVGLARQRRTH